MTKASRADVPAAVGHSPWSLRPRALLLESKSKLHISLLSERLLGTSNLRGFVAFFLSPKVSLLLDLESKAVILLT